MHHTFTCRFVPAVVCAGFVLAGLLGPVQGLRAGDDAASKAPTLVNLKTSQSVAKAVDWLIADELRNSKTVAAARTSDEDFLRRVTFDLAGTVSSPAEVTLFGLDPDPRKRQKLIDRLLDSDEFARNWAGYWRDVIFTRATEMRSRIAQGTFERWMTEQFKTNPRWDEIARTLITATGDVRENGETALIFAHGGQAAELAAETSRIFLGIQLQCANCHDHPTDRWKREDFHQLAAFFPRIRIRPKRDGGRRSFEVVSFDVNRANRRRGRNDLFSNPAGFVRRLDNNGDGKISRDEVKDRPQLARLFDRLLERGDTDQDMALSLAELKKIPRPNNRRRGSNEHYMPDLTDPASRGKKVDPVFFVDGTKAKAGSNDLERRTALVRSITSAENPWFARAFVNRLWAEMLGEGFYMPIDDIGPQRTPRFPKVLGLLCDGFIANAYDVKWLYRTIANTETYQRQIRSRDASDTAPPFASATPTRLRGDQLYSALIKVLGVREDSVQGRGRGPYGRARSGRGRFNALFGFDPSTPQEDLTGNVPQALFMMNSPFVNGLIRGEGETRLGRILKEFDDDQEAVSELYLLVLARDPAQAEMKLCLEYLSEVKDRQEAFEDLMWSLLNSSEFLSKR